MVNPLRHPATGVSAAFAATLLAGCASAPPPTEQLGAATAAYETARSAGAAQLAPTEFATTQQRIEEARLSMLNGDNERARRLAEEAEADARLASAKASEVRSQNAVNQVEQGLQALQDELRRAQQ